MNDNGTGWLVSGTGSWVPVAYNASVNGGYEMKRAAFVSLAGVRRTAGRGREPRTWEVTETVPYDWAQALNMLWLSSDSLEPMYWIPPLAAWSNYAPMSFSGAPSRMLVSQYDAPGVALSTPSGYDTDFFPVKKGLKLEFGGYQDGGEIRLRLFKTDFISSAGTVSLPAKDMLTESLKKVTISNPEAAWARLETSDGAYASRDKFVRFAVDGLHGVRKIGDGGCWVTLDDVHFKHGKLTTYNPLVDVSFTITECER